MKSQCRSNEVNDRRGILQLDPAEIPVPREVTSFQVPAHAKPIVRSLQRKMDVFVGFQLKNSQSPAARYRQQVENPVFTAAVGEDLRVNKSRIERGIDPRHVLAHQGLQPALRLHSIQWLTHIAGSGWRYVSSSLTSFVNCGRESAVSCCRGSAVPKKIRPSCHRAIANPRNRNQTSRNGTDGCTVIDRGARARIGSRPARARSSSDCVSRWGTSQLSTFPADRGSSFSIVSRSGSSS